MLPELMYCSIQIYKVVSHMCTASSEPGVVDQVSYEAKGS